MVLRRQRVPIARRGDKVRRRMGAILQGKLGFTSEELIRYGFQPRKLPIRRRPKQEPAPVQPPPVQPKATAAASTVAPAAASPAIPAPAPDAPTTEGSSA